MNEREAFRRFVENLQQSADWGEVASRPEPEPDLLCIHVHRGPVAFELVSLVDPEIAKVFAAGPKARIEAFLTSDSSERIVRKKLEKTYTTNAPGIELLVYTDGRTILPDDGIIPTLMPLFGAHSHPFKRIWFMGEHQTCQLWGDA